MDAQAIVDVTRLLWGPPVVMTSAWQGQANAMVAATTLAYLDCRVVGSLDGGDLTCYLADVVDGARLRPGVVMTYSVCQANIPPAWKPDYEAMLVRQMAASRAYFDSQRLE